MFLFCTIKVPFFHAKGSSSTQGVVMGSSLRVPFANVHEQDVKQHFLTVMGYTTNLLIL